ncbi:MAG: CD1845 family protein [Lactobacillus iners]|nr:CD1845 family protein [Lactobacillus iners]MCT7695820.1 CD1845 family protein [Lactobacillus iners]MCT7746815.1 CD1845 family protein [Lactobacillus iners]MCT7752537.1 CD1845 family protein [Lactobacillus iners]MCT7765188.1 CD1845 family protein [Lactobacillus iners]
MDRSSLPHCHSGFLFSPYGLEMIGATVIAFIELINYKIKAV